MEEIEGQTQAGAVSTNESGNAGAPAEDPVKNMKAEFQRKYDNLAAELKAMASKIQPVAPAAPQPKKLTDLMYEDPEQFVNQIKSDAKREVMSEISERDARVAKQNATLGQLAADFPELTSTDSALTKRAVEIYNALPEDERTSPMAMKVAVKDAALELGLRPKSKRNASENTGDGLMPTGGGSAVRKPQGGKAELDPVTEGFAAALGLNTSDAKVRERLKKRSERKTWNQFE